MKGDNRNVRDCSSNSMLEKSRGTMGTRPLNGGVKDVHNRCSTTNDGAASETRSAPPEPRRSLRNAKGAGDATAKKPGEKLIAKPSAGRRKTVSNNTVVQKSQNPQARKKSNPASRGLAAFPISKRQTRASAAEEVRRTSSMVASSSNKKMKW